jgi:hypothetical protein
VTFGTFVEIDGKNLFCGDDGVEGQRISDEFGFWRNREDIAGKGCIRKIGSEREKNNEKDGSGARGLWLRGIFHQSNFPTFWSVTAQDDLGLGTEG